MNRIALLSGCTGYHLGFRA